MFNWGSAESSVVQEVTPIPCRRMSMFSYTPFLKAISDSRWKSNNLGLLCNSLLFCTFYKRRILCRIILARLLVNNTFGDLLNFNYCSLKLENYKKERKTFAIICSTAVVPSEIQGNFTPSILIHPFTTELSRKIDISPFHPQIAPS